MIQSSVEIRSATPDELPHAVAAIVAAFVADPPARFAWPSPHDYLQAMPVATHAFAGSCVEFGTAYVSTDLRGAALWLPPGAQADVNALDKVFRATVKREHLDDLLATFERMEQSHPRESHWYLPQIGVDPAAQGQGLGAKLMRHAPRPSCDPAFVDDALRQRGLVEALTRARPTGARTT